MATVEGPLSPHLQVYKMPLAAMLSITHRFTGIFLSLAALALCCWLLAVAGGENAYDTFMNQARAWYGQVLILGFVFSLYYHLCNGIRHLFWDAGKGLDIETTNRSGYAVIFVSILLSALTFIAGYMT